MNLNVYSIYDQKLGAYSQPFYAQNAEVAARSFSSLATDPSTVVAKHPADFYLFALGTFDDSLGAFTNYDAPQNLGNALNLKEKNA